MQFMVCAVNKSE